MNYKEIIINYAKSLISDKQTNGFNSTINTFLSFTKDKDYESYRMTNNKNIKTISVIIQRLNSDDKTLNAMYQTALNLRNSKPVSNYPNSQTREDLHKSMNLIMDFILDLDRTNRTL